MKNLFWFWFSLLLIGGCSFSDPELDKEIDKYRGTGIQQQGNVLPPHELEDIED